jgi:hypothetical protein
MRYIQFSLTAALLIGGLVHAASALTGELGIGQLQGAAAQPTPTPDQNEDKKKKPGGGGGVDTLVMTGTVSNDGTQFVSDTDNQTWKIQNPQAMRGNVGHKVKVKGHFNAAANTVRVDKVASSSNADKK